MSQILDEIDTNYARFSHDWPLSSEANRNALLKNEVFRLSYRRITAIQALRAHLIDPYFTEGSKSFFLEAQNDALVSHVNAGIGGWRSALQALRSCIENVMTALYYVDHSIELELWDQGAHRISFAELCKYFEGHPKLKSLPVAVRGTDTLKSEYAKLSRAVHGSAASFRMTDQASAILLWSADPVKASMWSSREGKVLEGISILVVALNASRLKGMSLAPVREVLALTIGPVGRGHLSRDLEIHIPDMP